MTTQQHFFQTAQCGRPLSWTPPSIHNVCKAIVSRGGSVVANLDSIKGCKGSLLRELLHNMGCPDSVREQSWLVRLWRKADGLLKKLVCDGLGLQVPMDEENFDCSSPEVGPPSAAMGFSCILHFSLEEWLTIKPAVTKSGSIKLVNWTQMFSRKLASQPRTASCTLKGCQHVVRVEMG